MTIAVSIRHISLPARTPTETRVRSDMQFTGDFELFAKKLKKYYPEKMASWAILLENSYYNSPTMYSAKKTEILIQERLTYINNLTL